MSDNDNRMDQLLESAAPDLKAIKDLMNQSQTMAIDLLRALYFIDMTKKVPRYGKVGFTIKDGEIVSVWQEGQFICDHELNRNLSNMLRNK